MTPVQKYKLQVAAFFSAGPLTAFCVGLAVMLGAAIYLGTWAGLAAFVLTILAVVKTSQPLLADPGFQRQVLEGAGMEESAGEALARLEVMKKLGKLPPGWAERVERLERAGSEVVKRLSAGAGTVLDHRIRALEAPCREALGEALDLAAQGASAAKQGKDAAGVASRVDRIVATLESIRGDLATMGGGQGALPGDRVVAQLEDLSGEVRTLKETLDELEGT